MIMGDEVVEQALAGLEQVDRDAGQAARAATTLAATVAAAIRLRRRRIRPPSAMAVCAISSTSTRRVGRG